MIIQNMSAKQIQSVGPIKHRVSYFEALFFLLPFLCTPLVVSAEGLSRDYSLTNAPIAEIKKMAEQGKLSAQLELGARYLNGEGGVEKSDEEAFKWLWNPAQNGHVKSQYFIGRFYYYGLGVPKNMSLGLEWLRKAAEQGHESAMGEVLLHSTSDTEKVKFACKLAAKYPEESKGAQHPFREVNPLGSTVNYSEAIKWIRMVAEKGNAECQFILGCYYVNGYGVDKDNATGMMWFRKAAEQGHVSSYFHLGRGCFLGVGLPKDYIEAYKWTNLAAAGGDEQCADIRNELERLLTPAQIDEAQRRSSAFVPRKPSKRTD